MPKRLHASYGLQTQRTNYRGKGNLVLRSSEARGETKGGGPI